MRIKYVSMYVGLEYIQRNNKNIKVKVKQDELKA